MKQRSRLGSPPQVRGKLCNLIAVQLLSEDHPRRCGENLVCPNLAGMRLGSPPQVRGKPSKPEDPHRRLRITPAGAGKTAQKKREPELPRDHPRRCGENSTTCDKLTFPAGSPPQVRGKRGYVPVGGHDGGITPAGAGKTIIAHFNSSCNQDHPRRCGENTKKIL